MKRTKLFKRIAVLALSLVMLAGVTVFTAGAADYSVVSAEVRPNVTIVIDGAERIFYNAQGQEVHPIFRNGTHYLPVRAIGELMGRNVNWDQKSMTLTLAGARITGTVTGTPDTGAKTENVTVQIRRDFTVVVDREVKSFADEDGRAVYPVLFNGSIYLPVRAIGELMGKTVTWNGSTMTITMARPEEPIVTDVDSFTDPQPEPQPQTQPTAVTADQAKSAALEHAGLAASQVTFIRAELDRDNGHFVYDVEFYTVDRTEYDYEIDAATGAVIHWEKDLPDRYEPETDRGSAAPASVIGEERAKSIALGHAGLTSGQVTRLRVELDNDDGRWEYNVDFNYGTTEYDYEIDAVTGAVIKSEKDTEDDRYDDDRHDYDDDRAPSAQPTGQISQAQAEAAALSAAGLTAGQVSRLRSELDHDDGRWEYNVEFISGGMEYEYEIDAATGSVLSRDIEPIDD